MNITMVHDKQFLLTLGANFRLDESGTMRTLADFVAKIPWLKPQQIEGLVKALQRACCADVDSIDVREAGVDAILKFRKTLLGRWQYEFGSGDTSRTYVAKYEYHFHGDWSLDVEKRTRSSTMSPSGFGTTGYARGSGTNQEFGVYVVTKPGIIWYASDLGLSHEVKIKHTGNTMNWNRNELSRLGP